MYRLILNSLLVLLLTCSVFGQEQAGEQIGKIRGFKGLDTRTGEFVVPQSFCRTAHDLDWGVKPGTITRRTGYDSVSAFAGIDSLISVDPLYFSDGTSKLLVVVDTADSGYGKVYVTTNNGSSNIESDSLTEIWPYWSLQGETGSAISGDNIILYNTYSRGIIYDGENINGYNMPSPGEPNMIPTPDGNELDGEYIYVFKEVAEGGGIALFNSYATRRVTVEGGRVRMWNFQYVRGDSLDDTRDTVSLKVYRTKANQGRITEYTEAYSTGDTVHIGGVGDTTTGVTFIDSTPDADLDTTLFITKLIRQYNIGDVDSYLRNYGAPGRITSGLTASGSDSGVYNGLEDEFVGGWFWTATFFDTLLSIESDTGLSLFFGVFPFNQRGAESFTVTIPKVRDGLSNTIVRLYRGRASIDLATSNYSASDFYLLGEFSPEDSTFVDTMSYETLQDGKRFSYSSPPSLNYIFNANARLFGVDEKRSRLHFSNVDTVSQWGPLDFLTLDVGDGDVGIVGFDTRTAVRYAKNYSMYNVYKDANGVWNQFEVSHGFGCVARKSYALGERGHYYLSANGVVRENEGPYLERTQAIAPLSEHLDNFTKLPTTTLRLGVGHYHDQKYMLSFPALDTTYVFDERAEAWATWSLVFAGAFEYGAGESVGYIPRDTMYFWKPGGNTLFRYGGLLTDNGDSIGGTWVSVPFLVDEVKYQINSVGLWRTWPVGFSPVSIATNAILYRDGFAAYADTLIFGETGSNRCEIQTRSANDPSLYYQIVLDIPTVPSISIDGLDIYYTGLGALRKY